MIFGIVLSLSQIISYYGLTIPLTDELTEWSKSTKTISFLDNEYEVYSNDIISIIDSNGEFTEWQKIQLSIKISKTLFPEDTTKFSSLCFYLFKNFGYDIVASYNQKNEMIPLVASEQSLYGMAFFKIRGQRYYDLLGLTSSNDNEKQSISLNNDDQRVSGTKKIYIDFLEMPTTGKNLTTKILIWEYKSNLFSFAVPVNMYLRSYYHDLPHLDYGYFLNYQFSEELRTYLIDPLRERFAELKWNDVDRAECLRQMILQCFPYIDDMVLFGYEHVQFPEELLLSEGCDCEDRAIFLYKLLIELTDLTPLLADYPKHVSVLVEDEKTKAETKFIYKGKSFMFCDPTFFNAPIGAVPEAIKNIQPEIIERKGR